MTDDRRDEQGRFAPEYSDGEFLDAVREHEPAGTSEVADAVGCTTQNADYRLRKLRDAGRVKSKKVGRSLVWTLSGDESEA
jgi:predicted transcriptional regulator